MSDGKGGREISVSQCMLGSWRSQVFCSSFLFSMIFFLPQVPKQMLRKSACSEISGHQEAARDHSFPGRLSKFQSAKQDLGVSNKVCILESSDELS